MLLAIDIGNSAIKFGIFDGDKLTEKLSIATNRDPSTSEIEDRLGGRVPSQIDAAIACSVVPEAESALSDFVRGRFGVETRFVRFTDDFGLTINFNIATTGSDRLVNSYAAASIYGVPCIVVSFGTATTIDVVNSDREYLGGVIAPGMKASARALSFVTSKLPDVEIDKPDRVISKTTETAIRSGIVYGQIAMVEGLLKRVIDELAEKPRIIATGGFAELIAESLETVDEIDKDLTLKGLASFEKRDKRL